MKYFLLTLNIIALAQEMAPNKCTVLQLNYISLNDQNTANIKSLWHNITKNDVSKSIIFDVESNKIILRATKQEIKLFKDFINKIDFKPARIKLEFIIVETSSNFTYGFGINWSGIYNRLNSIKSDHKNFAFAGTGGTLTDIPTPTEPISPRYGNLYVNPEHLSINLFNNSLKEICKLAPNSTLESDIYIPIIFGGPDLNTRRLNAILEANQRQNQIKIKSRPSLIISENEVTKFFVGESLPFYTRVIDTIPGESKNTSQGAITNISSIEYQNVGLSIQAQITTQNKVLNADLFLEITHVESGSISTDINGIMQDPPKLVTTKIKNNFLVENGQMVMLVANEVKASRQAENNVPYVNKVPLFGRLFSANAQHEKSNNVLIFLTATRLYD